MILRKDWIYITLNNYLYIDITNPKKTLNKLKGIFKPLKYKFRFTKESDYYPILWCSTPSWIHIVAHDVGWKDKDYTPRYEVSPYIWIHLFKLNFIWYLSLEDEKLNDDYWEQALWYLYYNNTYSQGLLDNPDINKAKESWPWRNFETKENTWNDEFLI